MRIFVTAAAAVFALSLMACGDKEDDTAEDTSAEEAAEEEAAEESDTGEETE